MRIISFNLPFFFSLPEGFISHTLHRVLRSTLPRYPFKRNYCEDYDWVKAFNCYTFWSSCLTLRLHSSHEVTTSSQWLNLEGVLEQGCFWPMWDLSNGHFLLWGCLRISQSYSAVWGSSYTILLPSPSPFTGARPALLSKGSSAYLCSLLSVIVISSNLLHICFCIGVYFSDYRNGEKGISFITLKKFTSVPNLLIFL